MAEAFGRTIKRDYVHVSPRPDAETVMRQLPAWIAHYNEVHPHKALGYRSRQFSINEFLLKDRCALPDQMSFVFTFSRRRFILAMRDGDGANKNKIAVFDFGVTPKHFPHDMLLYDHRSPRSALGAVANIPTGLGGDGLV
jgi:hypothetical protein